VAGHRWVGYLVWATLFGALIAWEAIGLARAEDAYPTLSDGVRALMRYPIGRWALFALWLWVGWHAFIRGWHLPLRGSATGAAFFAYPGSVRQRWSELIGRIAGTAIGGYLLLLLVLVAYAGVARPPGRFLASAVTGTAVLVAVAVPAFLAAAWLGERRRIRDHPGPGR
jgi:Family of unknown function (DUF6256)/Family of unknown function (DUF6186)